VCLDYSRKLNLGISGSADDKLIAWTIDDDCRIVYKNEIITKNPGFNQILIRKDQKIVAAAGWDSHVRIFTAKKLKPLAVLSYHKENVQCLTFSTDNDENGSDDDHDIFETLTETRRNHPKRIICACILKHQ
jgi:WD40 repeat protein